METLQELRKEGISGGLFFKITAADGREWLEDKEGNEVVEPIEATRPQASLPIEPRPVGAFEGLMADIEATMKITGQWKMSDWRDRLIIYTRLSERPERSSNGGDYDYFRVYHFDGLSVQAWDDWSCDFSDYNDTPTEYNVIVSKSGLERMAKLATVTVAARAWLNKEPGCMKKLKDAIRSLGEAE